MHSSALLSLFCLFFCEVAVGVGGSDTLLVTIEPEPLRKVLPRHFPGKFSGQCTWKLIDNYYVTLNIGLLLIMEEQCFQPFVLVLTKSSSVVGVASLLVVSFCRFSLFQLCFILFSYFYVSFVLFVSCVCLLYCLSHHLQGGYTITIRWGGTTVILLSARGTTYSCLCRSFVTTEFVSQESARTLGVLDVCVFFTLNNSFYPSPSSTPSVRADSSP